MRACMIPTRNRYLPHSPSTFLKSQFNSTHCIRMDRMMSLLSEWIFTEQRHHPNLYRIITHFNSTPSCLYLLFLLLFSMPQDGIWKDPVFFLNSRFCFRLISLCFRLIFSVSPNVLVSSQILVFVLSFSFLPMLLVSSRILIFILCFCFVPSSCFHPIFKRQRVV